MMMRRKVLGSSLAGVIAASFSLVPADAAAESITADCVGRLSASPITITVPNEAGGGYDTYARAFASGLEEVVGSPVRVSNMPAAGGRLAYMEVVQQDPNEIVLLVDNLGDLVSAVDTDTALEFGSDAFTALGILVSEPIVWLGSSDIDLADPSLEGLIVGANAVGSNLIEAGLVGRALGLNMRVVAGYDGSSETTAAVMRDETDIAVLTITTALRRSEGTDLKVLLVLQNEPHASAPDAWVFGGADGLVDQRSAGMSEAERTERQDMAGIATALTGAYRAVLTGSHLEDGLVQCLRSATDAVLNGTVLAEAAGAQGRPVEPIFSDRSAQLFEEIRQSQVEVLDELESLEAELAE